MIVKCDNCGKNFNKGPSVSVGAEPILRSNILQASSNGRTPDFQSGYTSSILVACTNFRGVM